MIANLHFDLYIGCMDLEQTRYNVRLLRESRGWEQKDLAAAAKVSPSYVSRLEGGQTKQPRYPELHRLAAALDVSLDDLDKPLASLIPPRPVGLPPDWGVDVIQDLREQVNAIQNLEERMSTVERSIGLDKRPRTGASIVPRDAYWLRFSGEAAAASTADGERLSEDEPDEDEFILVVTGDCLTKRIQPGDHLRMSKLRRAMPGDIVSVIIDNERYLKRLVSRNGLWVLESNYGELRLPPGAFALEAVMILQLRGVG